MTRQMKGWIKNPEAVEKLIRSMPAPYFSKAAPDLIARDDGSDVFLYKAWDDLLKAHPNYPAQEIGDCTSVATGHAIDLLACAEIVLGDKEEYKESSTEALYGIGREIAGMLGQRSDGCYGAAMAKALTLYGIIPREEVGAYSGERAKRFGYYGTPAEIKERCRQHPVGTASLCTTLEELGAGLFSAYPTIVCSNRGFTLRRDQDGYCLPSGSWAHCMAIVGRRRLPRPAYCILQSWGPDTPTGPLSLGQPSYSFWADAAPVAKMLAARDSWTLSNLNGFPSRKLPSGWSYMGAA